MSDNEEYLGYCNSETMQIALWALNDGKLYDSMPRNLPNEELAVKIEEYINVKKPLVLKEPFSWIIDGFMDEVNFEEIAESLNERYRDERESKLYQL